jgi:hypothetical protein
MAMTRLAARSGRSWSASVRLGPASSRLRLAFVLLIVGLTISIIAGALVAGGQPSRPGPDEVLAERAVVEPFIGLPPQGATPSSLEVSEPVLSFYGGTTRGPRTSMSVYADGRVISQQDADRSYGANSSTTGYIEQRLTSLGVELLRSEAISTGLFDRDRVLNLAAIGPCLNFVEVHNGDRPVSVRYARGSCNGVPARPATSDQATALYELDARLGDPSSWLPALAWVDQRIGAYVPSRFAVCTQFDAVSLPKPAQDLLRSKGRIGHPVAESGKWIDPPADLECSVVDTEEARFLAQTFDEAGYVRDDTWALEYRVTDPRLGVQRSIVFEPIFPDGGWGCSACG